MTTGLTESLLPVPAYASKVSWLMRQSFISFASPGVAASCISVKSPSAVLPFSFGRPASSKPESEGGDRMEEQSVIAECSILSETADERWRADIEG